MGEGISASAKLALPTIALVTICLQMHTAALGGARKNGCGESCSERSSTAHMASERSDDVLEGTQAIADALGFRGTYVNVRRRVVGMIERHQLPAFKVAGDGPWCVVRAELAGWWERTRAQLQRDARAQLPSTKAA
jgi:hypothetical protein